MNSESHEYLKKTIFWQRFAVVVLSVFMLIMWGGTIYFFAEWLEEMSNAVWPLKRNGLIISMVILGYLVAGTYVDYILFQAQQALTKYIESSDMIELELAFRKQRHFWMGLTLMVLSFLAVFLLVMLLFVTLPDR